MVLSFKKPILMKEGNTVTWNGKEKVSGAAKREISKDSWERKLQYVGLRSCKKRQIDQLHKIERLKLIPNINKNMEYDKRERYSKSVRKGRFTQ